ncbi:OLC1v1034020C1 [Oldenlandia corymbosa var. corymbosa]|uniref:OLC1v1034020C1 n=1 Tax=Oldenlandia corymbosa var. corymbosa TaxID=529605 RepID=A0AAV1CSJ0_OLDCO|nr:OLC1v1034020C1 [Oldenlandia corymbosa var. corymbosa]
MVGWQRHLQTLLRQTRRRFEGSCISSPCSAYHSKASSAFGEVVHGRNPWNSHFSCTTRPLHRFAQQLGFTTSRMLLSESSNETPVSSPLLTPLALESGKVEPEKAVSKPETVQAILKGIKQSPKKVNLVAALVRGMRVEDALMQLQVTVKRASKTVYQVVKTQILMDFCLVHALCCLILKSSAGSISGSKLVDLYNIVVFQC